MRIQTTSIIRDRGQLTIPETIRKTVGWVSPLSAVSISIVHPDEIVIRPHRSQKEVDWDRIWKSIKKSRSLKGKGRGSLSKFIAEDRYRH